MHLGGNLSQLTDVDTVQISNQSREAPARRTFGNRFELGRSSRCMNPHMIVYLPPRVEEPGWGKVGAEKVKIEWISLRHSTMVSQHPSHTCKRKHKKRHMHSLHMREYITKLVKLLDYPSSNNVNMVGYRRLKRAWSYTDNKQHAWPLQYTNGTQHVWSQHTNTCRPAKMDLFVPPPNSTHIPCHSAILYPQHIDSTSVCCITFIRSKSDCFLIPRFYIFIMCNQCSHRVFVSGLFKLSAFRVCKAFFFA